jgi:ornithine carbamoyltransferase
MRDLSVTELRELLAFALRMKREGHGQPLAGRTLALLFEKPSLRTRVSFEVAMRQLGGHSIYLGPREVGLGIREPVKDVARVLSQMVDGISARVHDHAVLEELVAHAGIPVVNALSVGEHPCQALADLLTIQEQRGSLEGLRLAYVGDGNNVGASLALGSAMVGMHFRIASPKGYELPAEVIAAAGGYAASSGSKLEFLADPRDAVSGADVVYTDVWTSMGQEAEAAIRLEAFAGYQVDANLLKLAAPDAMIMHDLPAHRGEEITEDVLEGPHSVVFQQAGNRLHAQKALLVLVLGGESG